MTMFFYTVLFLGSLAGAVVVLIFLRNIFDTSGSVYTSKEHIAIVPVSTPGQKGDKATRSEVVGPQPTPAPASSPGQINMGWDGDPNQSGEQGLSHASAVNASRCSLYDVSTPDSISENNRNVGWSFSEEERESSGNIRKTPRKVTTATSDSEALDKPWGW